jgi:endonuclease/exonuclease/phosphatase (EEP) superfamily protein YafD
VALSGAEVVVAERSSPVDGPDDDEEDSLFWPTLVGWGLTLSILAVLGGFLGWLHPFGDLLAVGRAFAVAAVLILAIAASLFGMRMAAFWSILFALLAGTPVVLATVFPGAPGTFTLYQKNLKYRNDDLAALAADIRAAEPLAITLQEVSEPNLALLADLAEGWPHQLVCPFAAAGGTAVASRLPPVPGATVCADGLAAMQVMWNERPVWIVSIHLHWPWPYGQAAQARGLRPVLAGLEGSVLIGGDFNMVRWGNSVQGLAQAARTVAAGPAPGSYLGFEPLLRLPIDHTFAPAGGRVDLRPALGSDHLGLLARLEP